MHPIQHFRPMRHGMADTTLALIHVFHWLGVYHGITQYISTSGAMNELYIIRHIGKHNPRTTRGTSCILGLVISMRSYSITSQFSFSFFSYLSQATFYLLVYHARCTTDLWTNRWPKAYSTSVAMDGKFVQKFGANDIRGVCGGGGGHFFIK